MTRGASPSRLAPKCAPPKRGVVCFRSFGFHGRHPTSASDGVGRMPPRSLAFQPECQPLDRHRTSHHADPRARRRRASEGNGNASEGNGADLAELDSTR